MIQHRTGDYYGDGTQNLIWEVIEDGQVIAELYVAAANGLIMNVSVNEDRQGEGHTRALYEAATTTHTIYHVPAWGCTEDGLAFAEAMGGETMDEEEAAAFLGVDLSIFDAA